MPKVAVCLSTSLPLNATLLKAQEIRSFQATGYQGHYKATSARLSVTFHLQRFA